MDGDQRATFTAFQGLRPIITGGLRPVAREVKERHDLGDGEPLLVFHDGTGEQVDLDLGGTAEECLERLPREEQTSKAEQLLVGDSAEPSRGRGRPKLGVVAREVTLLPRHWEWLGRQPGGASVALRKLVDQARKQNETLDRVRSSREAAYRFMVALCGNLPGFEEASRALFAGARSDLEVHIAGWPEDVRQYLLRLARGAYSDSSE